MSEDFLGDKDIVSNANVILEADRDQDGNGELVFRTKGLERARIRNDGTMSGFSSSGSSAVTLLTTTTLAVDGTIDVTGISQAYSDLLIVAIARGTAAATTERLCVRINNDSGTNYDSQFFRGVGGAASANEQFGDTSIPQLVIPSASDAAGLFAFVEMVIPGYTSTVWQKTVRQHCVEKIGTATSNMQCEECAGFWRSTAAINQLTFFGLATANLLAGSTVRVYGRL